MLGSKAVRSGEVRVNHSRCLGSLWDTIMSSTYTPTIRMLSSTRLLNKHQSCVELEKPMLSTRCFLNLSCHMREACLVPYNALRSLSTHGGPLGDT